MNQNDLDQRLDQAIDALNNEASPAPYEGGDRELFSLVDTARLAKSLRDPSEPDADFPQLAIDRITADLRQTAPGNGVPPAATPAIGAAPNTRADNGEPRGSITFLRRHAELAAIILVLLLVGSGILIYQNLGPDDDGSPAVSVPGDDDGVVADATPTASVPVEDADPARAVTELRIDGALCCSVVHGAVDGEDYIFMLTMAGSMQVVHIDELGSLEIVGELDTPVNITPSMLTAYSRLAFDDGTIYAPLPGDDASGLWIVDVTDPAAPVEIALVETEMPPLSVAASNGVAAVAPMSFTGPLYVFDISDPTNAELVGEHDFSVASMPPAMEFDESLLYLTGSSGVVVIDLTDPASLQEAGSFPNPEWDGPPVAGQMGTGTMDNPWFRDATLVNGHLVIAAGNAGVRIVDVSDPANLHEVGHLNFEYPVFRVAATNTDLYALDMSLGSPGGSATMSEPHRIHTVDVSDIANPHIGQSTLGPDGGMVQWLLTVNDNLYLLDYGIIRMFDAAQDEPNSSDAQPEVVITPDESVRCVASNLVEAQAMSAFPIVLPDDLPDGMELDAVLLEHWAAVEPVVDCEGADYVTTWYQVTVGTEQHSPIRFAQTTFGPPQFDGNDSQEVEVNGKEVTRYSSDPAEDGSIFYVWEHDVISYVLSVPPQTPIAESDLLGMIEAIPIPESNNQPSDDVPDVTADAATIKRFREIQSEADFDLAVPTYLAGLQLAKDSPYLTGAPFTPGVIATWVDNTSTGPRRLGLNQRPGPLGAGRDQSNDETELIVIHGVETTLHAYSAPYEGGEDAHYLQVLWEKNGVNFMLSGVNLDRDTFLAIAESITPLSDMEESATVEPEATTTDAEPTPIHFPQFAPGTATEGMDADLSGEVVLEGGCIRVESDIGSEHPLLIWPEGFALQHTDGNVEVVNAEGDVVARVGEPINLWGGFWSAGNLESLEEMLVSPLPDTCLGPYWAMNPQTRPLGGTPDAPTDDREAMFDRFREVQQAVDFDISVPVEFDGFPLSGGSVETSGPPDAPSVLATFIDNSSRPPRMFSLNQRPGGFGADPDRSDHEAEDVTIQGIETTLYSRTTPGQDGTELDIYQVRWEMNGITYDLASTNVDRDTFLEIAESITPLSELEDATFATPEPDGRD